MSRAKPPADISPHEFFTEWIPGAVASDAERRRRLGDTDATIVFDLAAAEGLDGQSPDPGGAFTVRIVRGVVTGTVGASDTADLHVRVDVETWRGLNAGAISAPQALLKRKVRLHGDFVLGLKLHLILG